MQLDHILLRSTPTGTNQDTSIFERLVTTTSVTAEAFRGMSHIIAVAGAAADGRDVGQRDVLKPVKSATLKDIWNSSPWRSDITTGLEKLQHFHQAILFVELIRVAKEEVFTFATFI